MKYVCSLGGTSCSCHPNKKTKPQFFFRKNLKRQSLIQSPMKVAGIMLKCSESGPPWRNKSYKPSKGSRKQNKHPYSLATISTVNSPCSKEQKTQWKTMSHSIFGGEGYHSRSEWHHSVLGWCTSGQESSRHWRTSAGKKQRKDYWVRLSRWRVSDGRCSRRAPMTICQWHRAHSGCTSTKSARRGAKSPRKTNTGK